MEGNYNRVLLCGTLLSEPAYSHSNHGQDFYSFFLAVERLSGQQDKLPVLAAAPLLGHISLRPGEPLTVSGQLRSFNNKSGRGSRLVLSVFAHGLYPGGGVPENTIRLCGTVCKPPVFRRTPMGREICDVILAVNRRCGRADYLPCIAWGTLARQVGGMPVGQRLAAQGRVQSRLYRKQTESGCQERTAYEVSIMRLCPPEELFRPGIDFAAAGGIMEPSYLKEGIRDDSVR